MCTGSNVKDLDSVRFESSKDPAEAVNACVALCDGHNECDFFEFEVQADGFRVCRFRKGEPDLTTVGGKLCVTPDLVR